MNGWYALAKSSELRCGKPVRRYLFGVPVALFATAEGPAALVDRCPHRGAPLSCGKVIEGRVQCPYHGWTFDRKGVFGGMPCLQGEAAQSSVENFETCVHLGLVFVRLGQAPDKPYLNPLASQVKFWHALPGDAKTDLVEAAENFLDPVHTTFVHKQLVRKPGNHHPTRVVVTAGERQAEANYYGEGQAGGVVAGLMREGERSLSVGRFIGPNVAEVEFHGPHGVNFIMTGFFTPSREGELTGYGVVGLPGSRPWATIKFLLLWPWIRLVHRQDRRILELARSNNAEFGSFTRRLGPLDVLRPQIEAILAGHEPPARTKPITIVMNL